MANQLIRVKAEILRALSHDEASDGLYFSNLFALHEEDERPIVEGSEEIISLALIELMLEGKITRQGIGHKAIFSIAA